MVDRTFTCFPLGSLNRIRPAKFPYNFSTLLSSYGIALQKNSFWTERVTLQLLRLIESGFMETLDNKWILRTDKRCDKYLESSFPTTLGLENMAGVFILVGAGKLSIGIEKFGKPKLSRLYS